MFSGVTDCYQAIEKDLETSQVTVTNAPAIIPRLAVSQSLVGGGREVSPTKSGFLELSDGAGIASLIRAYAPADGTTMTRLVARDSIALGVQHIVQWGPSSTRTVVDAGVVELRPYVEAPRYVPDASLVRWEESASGTVADAVVTVLTYPRNEITPSWRWTLISARGEEPTLRLPVLPRADLVPPAHVEISELASVTIEGGYDRIRPYLLGLWQQDSVWPADTAAGRVDYQRLAHPAARF